MPRWQNGAMNQLSSKRKYESPRQLARQSKILATARDMLDEGGYDGLTMRGLASRAGVAQGTLYNLYGSKDDLVVAAVDDLLAGLSEEARRRTPEPGIDAILTHTQVTGANIVRAPAYAAAMTRIVMGSQDDPEMVNLVFARFYPIMLRDLQAAHAAGELVPDVDIDLVARHLTGNGWSVILLWIMGLVHIDQFVVERERNVLMTLISITQGARRTALEERLAALSPAS